MSQKNKSLLTAVILGVTFVLFGDGVYDFLRSSSHKKIILYETNGYFFADAVIEGMSVHFLVDTGSGSVALSMHAASKLANISFMDVVIARSAVGPTAVIQTRIPEMQIGPIVMRNVEAVIVPDLPRDMNLLGLSFLKKLHRMEYKDKRLTLEQ